MGVGGRGRCSGIPKIRGLKPREQVIGEYLLKKVAALFGDPQPHLSLILGQDLGGVKHCTLLIGA